MITEIIALFLNEIGPDPPEAAENPEVIIEDLLQGILSEQEGQRVFESGEKLFFQPETEKNSNPAVLAAQEKLIPVDVEPCQSGIVSFAFGHDVAMSCNSISQRGERISRPGRTIEKVVFIEIHEQRFVLQTDFPVHFRFDHADTAGQTFGWLFLRQSVRTKCFSVMQPVQSEIFPQQLAICNDFLFLAVK